VPFNVEVIQTDNGPEFGSQFHYHALDAGAGHVSIKPATPRLNGKVERSHRIDAEEFYRMPDGVVIDDTELFNDRLQELGALRQLRTTARSHGLEDAL
jgi:transposase InsO family protein